MIYKITIFTFIFTFTVFSYLNSNADCQEKIIAPYTSDEDFFKALNLDDKNMKKVKSAVTRHNWVKAKKMFVKYIKSRKKPHWFFKWDDKKKNKKPVDKNTISKADRYVKNEIDSVGIWYSFGDNIIWTANPTPDSIRNGHGSSIGKKFW